MRKCTNRKILESQTEVLAQQHPVGHDIAAHADSQTKTIPAQQHPNSSQY